MHPKTVMGHDLSGVPLARLADAIRAEYRALFQQLVAEGVRRPLVLTDCVVGAFIVPTLWLALPHSPSNSCHRWTRPATWLLVAFVVAFDLEVLWNASSTNMAFAYAADLASFWGILSTLNLLVWTSPQVDAARVVRRNEVRTSDEKGTLRNGHVVHNESETPPHENGLRKRTTVSSTAAPDQDHENGRKQEVTSSTSEYYWQSFPAGGSFAQRLNWAFDMTTNFRFVGKNDTHHALCVPNITTSVVDVLTVTYLQVGTGLYLPFHALSSPRSPISLMVPW